ncbi:Na+-translocating ferredoxin:NAD+ oxidoreductase RnfG subunit [Pseudacidovorax intermedius]|uniref:Na+-translocating ferredoxin:NAD+ oxidoreductase RnfG subunit n=1 Tax=Pseudacidovorax intermedius TaxID=433924 RepID=A0A370F821_9BURK|nr:Na+-translocating ferredoxin:NAD+ oxidoreductase RnfG subunit [Pseudacidovorax intermedius]
MTRMQWKPAALLPLAALGAALAPTAPVYAAARIYVSVEQAQRDLFGSQSLAAFPVVLTPAQQDEVRAASSVAHPFQGSRIWKAADGGWFVVDEVVGKHEMITYAVALDGQGRVRRVEVLEYHESYGYEVAEPQWLHQFEGKDGAAPLKLGKDVENISGATLSAKHLTDGVKRVLAVYGLVLRGR